MTNTEPRVVSADACGNCRALLIYGCRCQPPRCKRQTVPLGEGCLLHREQDQPPAETVG